MAVQGISSANQYASGALNRKQERSFAELYRQARTAQGNDNTANEQLSQEQQQESHRNREYIANLHDRVDTLRGEILARVITAKTDDRENADRIGGDVGRLNNRLESLRNKLREEEERLSGQLLNVTI